MFVRPGFLFGFDHLVDHFGIHTASNRHGGEMEIARTEERLIHLPERCSCENIERSTRSFVWFIRAQGPISYLLTIEDFLLKGRGLLGSKSERGLLAQRECQISVKNIINGTLSSERVFGTCSRQLLSDRPGQQARKAK